jgi:hypothetical protein
MKKRFSEGQIAFSEMDGSTHVDLVVVGSDQPLNGCLLTARITTVTVWVICCSSVP